MSHHIDYTFAAILATGGTFAFIKKKSTPSLVGGLTLAGAFVAAGYMVHQKYEYTTGHAIGTGAGATLAAVGASRYVKTKKPMPSLALLGLGLVACAYHAMKLTK